jgi:sialidase-1
MESNPASFLPPLSRAQRLFALLLLCGVVLVQTSPSSAGAATPSPAAPVDRAVLQGGEGGYHTYRIPAAVVTREGIVVLLVEGRKGTQSDFAAIDLLSVRSQDGGRTWSKTQIVWSEGSTEGKISMGNPTPVYDAITGRLWCVFNRENQRVFVTYSDNAGSTWARPREITPAVRPASWMRYWTGPGHGLQLTHGKNRGRLVVPSYHLELESVDGGDTSVIVMRSHMAFSDDHGQTWKIGESTKLASELEGSPARRLAGKWIPGEARWHGGECMVEEQDDGRLYLIVRDQARHDGRKAFAWSSDGGETWTPLSLQPQLPDPGCQASLIRYPNPSSPGTKIFLYSGVTIDHRAAKPIGDGGDGTRAEQVASEMLKGRQRLALYVSSDGCQSWREAGVVQTGPAAYSDLVALPDGDVLCFYEGGEKNAYESIRMARLDRKWLHR